MNEELRTTIKGHYFEQFGHEILLTTMPFKYIQSIFEVDHHVQRELDPRRRNVIRDFILHTVEETFHFSPFVYTARGNLIKRGENWEIKPGTKLFIIDGQHRSAALRSALHKLQITKETLEEMSNKSEEIEQIDRAIQKLENYPITMQIYLNLSTQEEQQMFTDLNTERKNAHSGLIMKYEQRDEYVLLARHIANKLANFLEVETILSRLTVQNTSITNLVIMKKCNLALFEGVLTHKEGEPKLKYCGQEEMEAIAFKFFKMWHDIFPCGGGNRKQYVCGLSGIQIALAYAVYQLVSNDGLTYFQAIDHLKQFKEYTTWKHNDPLFQDFYDEQKKRITYHSNQQSIIKLANVFLNDQLKLEVNSIGQ